MFVFFFAEMKLKVLNKSKMLISGKYVCTRSLMRGDGNMNLNENIFATKYLQSV